MSCYDVIVVGTGGVGSAALYHLAKRGVRALGIDQFHPGHDRGSSHGHTRIIRKAYFEHPDYVPLVERAYPLWEQLALETQQDLFYQVGMLEIGPPDGVVIPGVLESVSRHGLRVDRLSATQVSREFPALAVPDGFQAVFENDAGYLLVELCVMAHLEVAKRYGADLCENQRVLSWDANEQGVTVRTARGEYSAGELIISGGAWAGQLLGDLGIPLRVLAKHLHWLKDDNEYFRVDQGCPTFFYEVAEGYFYGFPQVDDRGVKVAEHSGGALVTDPARLDRSIDPTDESRVKQFCTTYLPKLGTQTMDHSVCMYTMSPDEHFIVDRHPDRQHVTFAAGLSGHAFKFTPTLGEALADLSLQQQTNLPIEFLRCGRFDSA